MTPLLWRALLRHPLRHPWQLALAVLGIALGVAVVVAVDLANASARRGFELAMDRLTGQATHRLSGGVRGLPEDLYVQLRRAGWRPAAPVLTGYLPREGHPGQVLQILGVDPLAEAPFRALAADLTGAAFDLRALLLEADAALLPSDLGERVTLRRNDQRFTLRRVGTLTGPGLEGLIITDLSTAQVLLDRAGWLSHIDLILPQGSAGEVRAAELRAGLPPGVRLERPAQRTQATLNLSAAFSLNLSAMSLLALMVGIFLIYNAMSFAVVQRRALLGLLRALGVSRRELLLAVLGEALLLGLAGVLLGMLLGLWIGSGLVHLVTRTINDLYYVVSVREFFINPASLAKGAALGVLGALAAAWLPAREAANAPPGLALSRAALESRWQTALPRLAWVGLVLLGLGALVLGASRTLIPGFAGLFLLILGSALLTPPTVAVLSALGQPLAARGGWLTQMANRDAARHLSRTGVAAAALMVAFATTVGAGVMVDSFRAGVTLWIGELINADLYVAPPAIEDGAGLEVLKPETLAALRATPGVAAVSTFRRLTVELDEHPVQVMAVELAPASQSGYRLLAGDPAEVWPRFQRGAAILVSEPLAWRRGLHVGDALAVPTDRGTRHYPIAGIFLDYGSEHGRILLPRSLYERDWSQPTVGSTAVFVAPGQDLVALRDQLQTQLGPLQPLIFRLNRDIQRFTLEIFERTFTITQVLRLLAIVVAVTGVLSALLALHLERAREFAILRTLGLSTQETGTLVALQTGLLGLAAGVLALPTGLMLAAALVFVINRRAFGWSLPFQPDPGLLLETVVLAVLAALLAGLYPIWRIARTPPAAALRTE